MSFSSERLLNPSPLLAPDSSEPPGGLKFMQVEVCHGLRGTGIFFPFGTSFNSLSGGQKMMEVFKGGVGGK